MSDNLNTVKPYSLYEETVAMTYFVDKSEILEEIICMLGTANKYLCITRPRRFGKTIMAVMIASYFTKGIDSRPLFDKLNISKSRYYKEHINKHQVIYMDFSELPYGCMTYKNYIDFLSGNLTADLAESYRDLGIIIEKGPWVALEKIFVNTGHKFIFIMDEWDSMFHNSKFSKKDQEEFLQFLKSLLKSKAYVLFAYMTGVLPILKYSSGSELNMFDEYNMVTSPRYSNYFGFTDNDVRCLFAKYEKITENPVLKFEELKEWYNGYHTAGGEQIYNPRSVVRALQDNHIGSYWTSSGPYDEIFFYISHNIYEVRADIVRMVAGEAIPAEISEYAAVSMELGTKNEIYSAMMVYGFLSFQDGCVSVPNKELMLKFQEVLAKKEMGYIAKLTGESRNMLRATLSGDIETMERILTFAHETETPVLNYNHETDLAALVNLLYLSARNFYRIEREDRAGKGYADLLFYPHNPKDDCIIIELKINVNPEEAILQIKERNYALKFKGRMGEETPYTGRIVAVGMAYNKKSKIHRCRVEILNDTF